MFHEKFGLERNIDFELQIQSGYRRWGEEINLLLQLGGVLYKEGFITKFTPTRNLFSSFFTKGRSTVPYAPSPILSSPPIYFMRQLYACCPHHKINSWILTLWTHFSWMHNKPPRGKTFPWWHCLPKPISTQTSNRRITNFEKNGMEQQYKNGSFPKARHKQIKQIIPKCNTKQPSDHSNKRKNGNREA